MIFGVDIGGANVKITQLHPNLTVKSVLLPFSRKPVLVEQLITSVVNPDIVVVTQTLCANRHLFATGKEGTHYLINVTTDLFGDNVRYPGLSYQLYTAAKAKQHYEKVACRNWVATCYLAHYLDLVHNGLVIDCGTTSTDIVPVVNGHPETLEKNDVGYTRFRTGELVWSGVYFMPVPSLSHTIVLDGDTYPVKPATRALSYDIYIVLGRITPKELAEKYSGHRRDMDTLSYRQSVMRMLDVISADTELLTVNDAQKIAAFLAEKQEKMIEKAIKKVFSAAQKKYAIEKTVAVAGAGKDIILSKVLKNLGFDVKDIEKAASNTFDMIRSEKNCETSLGCALMGLQFKMKDYELSH